jgi:hypothetical protein
MMSTSAAASSAGSMSSPEPPSLRVSTTFYPGAQLFSGAHSDIADVVLTTIPESIHFYVHSQHLLRRSKNAFAWLIEPPTTASSAMEVQSTGSAVVSPGQQQTPGQQQLSPSAGSELSGSSGGSSSTMSHSVAGSNSTQVHGSPQQQIPHIFIRLHEKADVLNLLLHAVYNLNPERYAPSLETLSCLPAALLNYGYSLDEHLAPDSELTRLFLNYARMQPIDVYALAAAYNLEHIAQRASKPSLGTKLSEVTNEQVRCDASIIGARLSNLSSLLIYM